jgi:hypothetical protein
MFWSAPRRGLKMIAIDRIKQRTCQGRVTAPRRGKASAQVIPAAADRNRLLSISTTSWVPKSGKPDFGAANPE